MKRLLAGILAGAWACGPQGPPPTRQWTDDMSFVITSDPVPPRAREDTKFTVLARDKSSGQPIEGADGRIYAQTHDGAKEWDGLVPGNKPGTYTAKLNFVVAGNWAMGMQFRRDTTTTKIEKMDWTQEVLAGSDSNQVR
jgi:YtkA-like